MVISIILILCVAASVITIACCCFLETSGEDPERYVVFKCDKLNVRRQELPNIVENSEWLINLVSIIEGWRNKLLCVEDTKNHTRVSCDISGIKIEIKGMDDIEEPKDL